MFAKRGEIDLFIMGIQSMRIVFLTQCVGGIFFIPLQKSKHKGRAGATWTPVHSLSWCSEILGEIHKIRCHGRVFLCTVLKAQEAKRLTLPSIWRSPKDKNMKGEWKVFTGQSENWWNVTTLWLTLAQSGGGNVNKGDRTMGCFEN